MNNEILLCGATGRMGQAIDAFIQENNTGFCIAHRFAKKSPDTLLEQLKQTSFVIDFSLPELTQRLLQIMCDEKLYRPLVIGTTGLLPSHFEKIEHLSTQMPILQQYNMSPGIHFLNQIIQQAPAYFDSSYDIDLYDRHHRNKIDAPSGTLKMLQSSLERAYGYSDATYAPDTKQKTARPNEKIGINIARCGNVFGEHEVHFVSEDEEIQLLHRAFNRKLFAKGAVMALNWLKNQPPGRYSMADMFK